MEEHGTLAHLATRVIEAAGHLAAAHVSASAQLASTVPTPHVVIPAQAQAAASANDDSVALADQLQWSSVKSIRTSVITLASFNVVAAAITIICVLRDARALDERNTRFQLRGRRFLPPLSPWQVYPLILSLATISQGIIFAVSQGKGLGGFVIEGCIPISQAMMPATFIVPFVQLILGVETAIASFFKQPFPPRARWVFPTCVAVAIAGLLGLYGATRALPPPDKCYASLFWFTQEWRPVSFGLFVGIASLLLIAVFIVFLRLRLSAADAPPGERQAASHMVYYITVAVISNTLMTPFFFSMTFISSDVTSPKNSELSTVASVVANLSGLMTGGLYLYLRGGSQTSRGSPWDYLSDNDKQEFVLLKQQQQKTPVPPPTPPMFDEEKAPRPSMSVAPPRRSFMSWLMPPRGANRDSSMSNINNGNNAVDDDKKSMLLLPSTTYSPAAQAPPTPASVLMPPPLFHADAAGKGSLHQRNLSGGSMETVQIGIRISNVNGPQDANAGKPTSMLRTQSRFPNLSQFFPPTMPVMDDKPKPPPLTLAPAAAAPASGPNLTVPGPVINGFTRQLPRNPSPLRNAGQLSPKEKAAQQQAAQKQQAAQQQQQQQQQQPQAQPGVASPKAGLTDSASPTIGRESVYSSDYGSDKAGWI